MSHADVLRALREQQAIECTPESSFHSQNTSHTPLRPPATHACGIPPPLLAFCAHFVPGIKYGSSMLRSAASSKNTADLNHVPNGL